MNDRNSLCWSCGNFCGRCSWSMDFIPVDGWLAIPKHFHVDKRIIDTYSVLECPQYQYDGRCSECKSLPDGFTPQDKYCYLCPTGKWDGYGDCKNFDYKYALEEEEVSDETNDSNKD